MERTADNGDDLVVTLKRKELRQLIAEEVAKALANGTMTDEWVGIERAGQILSVSTDWLYHNRKRLPFAKKIGRKQLRFSVKGIHKWMESTR